MESAALLREVRQITGMTLEELASRAGTSAPTLSNYERGHKEPRLGTLARILGAAGFDLVLDARPAGSTSPMTTKDQRSLALHRAVAARLVEDAEAVLTRARANLTHLCSVHADGSADDYLDAWAGLLDGPLDDVIDVLVSPRQRARDLRNTSPFAGVLSDEERRRVLATTRP